MQAFSHDIHTPIKYYCRHIPMTFTHQYFWMYNWNRSVITRFYKKQLIWVIFRNISKLSPRKIKIPLQEAASPTPKSPTSSRSNCRTSQRSHRPTPSTRPFAPIAGSSTKNSHWLSTFRDNQSLRAANSQNRSLLEKAKRRAIQCNSPRRARMLPAREIQWVANCKLSWWTPTTPWKNCSIAPSISSRAI